MTVKWKHILGFCKTFCETRSVLGFYQKAKFCFCVVGHWWHQWWELWEAFCETQSVFAGRRPPPNIDCCKYLAVLVFEEGQDDDGDWSYRVFLLERKLIRM